jgi:phosphonate transport system permease protein
MSAVLMSVQASSPGVSTWQRHSAGRRWAIWLLWLLAVAAVMQSLRSVEVIPEFLADAPEQMVDMLRRMLPPDWGHYKGGVHEALVETLHIATLGTLISLAVAVPLGVMVAANVVRSRSLNLLARVLLVSSRSVNSLVWALLFVAVFGPGALAGTIAIACRSVGFVGKLMGEALEETPPGPIEALRASGASIWSQLLYGYWPQIKPAFCSLVLLRWDINIRESAVLGLVGAGGVGMALDTAMNLFQWPRVALVLLAVLVVVMFAEALVTVARKRIL